MLKNLIFIILVFLSACSFSVSHVIPEPNINMPESEQTLALELDSDIDDLYTNNSVRVRHWKDSIESGFKNAFKDYYHFSKDSADLMLEIKRAELRIDPSGYYQSASGPEPSGYQATIEYSASLKNRNGRVLTRTANTAKAKRPFINLQDANDSVKSALEDMFEKIAHDLF